MKNKWIDRLNGARPHEVTKAPMNVAGMKKGDVMLVPSPRILDEFIKAIPEGESLNIQDLRRRLAAKFGAETTCPISINIHLRIVAEAAYEALGQGVALQEITPFWRVLDERAPTTQKLSCGVAFIQRRRQQEGVPSPTAEEAAEQDAVGFTAYQEKSLWA